MRPTTQADIERLYADPGAQPVELSGELVEHHIRRGRVLRSQVSTHIIRQAFAGLWRLATFSSSRSSQDRHHGRLTPSNV